MWEGWVLINIFSGPPSKLSHWAQSSLTQNIVIFLIYWEIVITIILLYFNDYLQYCHIVAYVQMENIIIKVIVCLWNIILLFVMTLMELMVDLSSSKDLEIVFSGLTFGDVYDISAWLFTFFIGAPEDSRGSRGQ